VYEIFTYGRFEVAPENEQAFIDAWSEFAAWASTKDGSPTIRLARDIRTTGRFVSIGQWENAEAIQAWKSSDEFREKLGSVVRLAAEFEPTELVVSKRVSGGSVETFSPPDLAPIHAPTG
jgi:heme-degrading monooxygenase HmoA